jgi:2-amino-4-hydroxy-6-hydroxymethyldihydropteridine diphosphokinase
LSFSEKVFLGLGSNLNNPKEQIVSALNELKTLPCVSELKASNAMTTPPLGGPEQPDYTNLVCSLFSTVSAETFLGLISAIEHKRGRKRSIHWGPRTIDIDILLYGDQIVCKPDLVIPHPEMNNRIFVLKPMLEIEPKVIDPITHYPFSYFLDKLTKTSTSIQKSSS